MHPYVYISIQTCTAYGITGLGSEVASPGQVPENQRLDVLAPPDTVPVYRGIDDSLAQRNLSAQSVLLPTVGKTPRPSH